MMSAYKQKKRGASPDARSTHEGLRIAQLVETSYAESPTYVYNIEYHYLGFPAVWITDQEPIMAIYDTPMRRPRCFVFDNP